MFQVQTLNSTKKKKLKMTPVNEILQAIVTIHRGLKQVRRGESEESQRWV